MDTFQHQLLGCKTAVERYVRYKLTSESDAEDLLQEVYMAAYEKYGQLKNKDRFKAWIISIARNKVNDYYRKKCNQTEMLVDHVPEKYFSHGCYGRHETNVVRETISLLGEKERQVLYLYYFADLSQKEIAGRLKIPEGTVKSRMYKAKRDFKENYPYSYRDRKGEIMMNRLPEYLPEYQIKRMDKEPFSVKWEELMGWFIIPREGKKLSWAIYDQPEGRRSEQTEMEVVGRAEIHGIEGVEIFARERDAVVQNTVDGKREVERRFVAQLTDHHCRFLAESHFENGVQRNYTFLDGDAFLKNWGFGEDNCGNEVNLSAKGIVVREGEVITSHQKKSALDIVGRYEVTMDGKAYDTVCVMDIESYEKGVVTEQYLDKQGCTILWRRFNSDDWKFEQYQKKWSEQLPKNERLKVNGKTFVHWYDCITDYIL